MRCVYVVRVEIIPACGSSSIGHGDRPIHRHTRANRAEREIEIYARIELLLKKEYRSLTAVIVSLFGRH